MANPGSLTYAYLLDIPLLTDDVADTVGYYAVVTGSRGGWTGGLLDVDLAYGNDATAFGKTSTTESSGANWYQVAKSDVLIPHGFCLTALPEVRPYVWDRTSKIRVRLLYTDITFSSASEDDLLYQPINAIMVGSEILQFANATDKGNGVWELDTFLRGLKGTEWAIGSHVVGEKFLRLKNESLQRITHDQKFLDQAGKYLALSLNQATADATPFYFTNTGNSLRPYAPDIRAHWRNSNGDVRLQWVPRARQNAGLINGSEVALGQSVEAYEIDVYSDAGAVVHTISLGAVREATIAASDLTTWIGSLPTQITFKLYQLGDIVGRGFAAEVTA